MKLNQRAALWAAAAALVLVVAAFLVFPPVFVVLGLALGGLGGLVWVSRQRQREGEEYGDWEGADEWGLVTEAGEEDLVDLGSRLEDVGLRDTTNYLAPSVEEEYEEVIVYEIVDEEGRVLEAGAEGEILEETIVYEDVWKEAEEPAAHEEPVAFEEPAAHEEPVPFEEPATFETPDVAAIVTDEGLIAEERVDSDGAILAAAAQVSSIDYDDVLSREDANAETRQILEKVASLLAKYE